MKKKNPTADRTYKMLMKDRYLRTKVFGLPRFGGRGRISRRIRKIAEKFQEGTLK